MKRLVLRLSLICLAALALGQTEKAVQNENIVVTGLARKTEKTLVTGAVVAHIRSLQQSKEGSLILYRGNVEIKTDTVLLQADEVDYHPDTAEAEARGNVRVKLLLPLPNGISSEKTQ